jgi:hypothetical protein
MPFKDPDVRRAYQREYNRRRYHSDEEFRQAHLHRVRLVSLRQREQAVRGFAEWRSIGCVLCGERELCCLVAHHVEPETKRFHVATAVGQHYVIATIRRELEKCVCLCHNCHLREAKPGEPQASRGDKFKIHASVVKSDLNSFIRTWNGQEWIVRSGLPRIDRGR